MTGASDDRGVSYQIGGQGGPAAGQLVLRPDPPSQLRWLDLTTATGEPATRIDLDRHNLVVASMVSRRGRMGSHSS